MSHSERRTIYHGGCHYCVTPQTKCPGCLYHSWDRDLPDLSNRVNPNKRINIHRDALPERIKRENSKKKIRSKTEELKQRIERDEAIKRALDKENASKKSAPAKDDTPEDGPSFEFLKLLLLRIIFP